MISDWQGLVSEQLCNHPAVRRSVRGLLRVSLVGLLRACGLVIMVNPPNSIQVVSSSKPPNDQGQKKQDQRCRNDKDGAGFLDVWTCWPTCAVRILSRRFYRRC